jgi:hypothetical protein
LSPANSEKTGGTRVVRTRFARDFRIKPARPRETP